MNITTQPVSFLPTSAAQPTDGLRRDNSVRDIITPLRANEAFNRERGLGTDSERRPATQERSYAQQVADARAEAGFPWFLTRVEGRQNANSDGESATDQRQSEGESAIPVLQHDDEPISSGYANSQAVWGEGANAATTLTYRTSDGHYNGSLNINGDGAAVDPVFLARGERIEAFYQSSYRPRENFLLGIA